MSRVAVMGTGSWGTTFAMVLADAGASVRLWGRRPELVRAIAEQRLNPDYVPEVALPDTVVPTADAAEALEGADLVVLAVPSQVMRPTLERWHEHIPRDAIVVSLAKGVELGSLLRMSQVIEQVAGVPAERVAVVSGPNLSPEIAARRPAATVVAAAGPGVAAALAARIQTPYLRAYPETDVIGVELGGATKNVVAVAVGMAEGLGLSDNTRATLITRGLAETVRLGVAMGARPDTFQGLSGVGDLIATCSSPLSRNHTFGVQLGQGRSLEEIVGATQQTAEGVRSSESILALAQRHGVDMPLVESVVAVVADGQHPALIGGALMARELKSEKS